jgi:Ca2+-dependent lipid-binding protein
MAAYTCFCLFIYKTSLFFSDKSKRRTKTVKKILEPKWNQTFVYSHVHRRDFRERMLEITVWDQPRVQEEESEFLGEVMYIVKTQVKCLMSSVTHINYDYFERVF